MLLSQMSDIMTVSLGNLHCYMFQRFPVTNKQFKTKALLSHIRFSKLPLSKIQYIKLRCFTPKLYTELFISPSGISELDCATTKTDTAERSISIGRESLQVFFVLGALTYFQVPPLGGSREKKWCSQWIRKRSVSWNLPKLSQLWLCNGGFGSCTTQNHLQTK